MLDLLFIIILFGDALTSKDITGKYIGIFFHSEFYASKTFYVLYCLKQNNLYN